jgi:hypothetical protein
VTCTAQSNTDEPNRLDVRIEYVIAGTNNKRNLVFPFYLRTEEDDELAAEAENGERRPVIATDNV